MYIHTKTPFFPFFSFFFLLKNYFALLKSLSLKFLPRYYQLPNFGQSLLIIIGIYNTEEYCWVFISWLPLVVTIIALKPLGHKTGTFCYRLESGAISWLLLLVYVGISSTCGCFFLFTCRFRILSFFFCHLQFIILW